jgi:hypothetical protein
MRYLDLIRERRDSDRKPAQTTLDAVSQPREFDPIAPQRETPPSPFDVGDKVTYQVPGDPEEGPFKVIEITESHGQWWALVAKPHSYAWVHEVLVAKEEQQ